MARLLLTACALLATAAATQVQHCNKGGPYEDPNAIAISNCNSGTCRLRRKSEVSVEFKIKPGGDVQRISHRVSANILGIPFPFIGVDDTSACDKVFDSSGAKASCPLKAGTEYVYKNSFKVLEIYPKIRTDVHWEIVDDKGKSVVCFEVPTRITS